MMMDKMELILAPYIQGYYIHSVDLERPWGGFCCIHHDDLDRFVKQYFGNMNIDVEIPLSPKILIIGPNKRLSWQYHYRRREIWVILKGPVGIIRSNNDTQNEIQYCNTGNKIIIDKEERHRLVGLDEYAIVAELWCHTDLSHLSDENDIVRVEDDFHRK
jgi:mannose-6-phosphate isomerase